MKSLYEEQRKLLIEKHRKNGELTLLGKWELAKLYMCYHPDKDIQPKDYQIQD